ncbi:MAG: beta-lactamase family protein [Deltaproteobacteria bacterium]|nr:beta-lactamase family protein [Deltaproteobacteria bacterium]
MARTDALSRKIDKLYDIETPDQMPGGVVGIAKGDKILHLGGYGCANIEWRAPWTVDTRYRIASVTKTFTAHAIHVLAKSGRLGLDDPITKYFPEYSRYQQPITVSNLLAMSSGFKHDEVTAELCGMHSVSTLEFFEKVAQRQGPLMYPPGSFQVYCCTNYRLLARLIEKVTSKPYGDAIREIVLEPEDLLITHYVRDAVHPEYQEARPYIREKEGRYRISAEQYDYATSGDGGLKSTLNEVLKYIIHISRPEPCGAPSVLERLATSVSKVAGKRPVYGHGVMLEQRKGIRSWGHGGAFNSWYQYFPDYDVTVACFNNDQDMPSNTTCWDAFRIYLEAFDPLAHAETFGKDTPAVIERLAGDYADMETGYLLNLEIHKGTLFANFMGSADMPMRAEGESEYWTHTMEVMFGFKIKNTPGQVRPTLRVYDAGHDQNPRIFQPITTSDKFPKGAHQYEGLYIWWEMVALHRIDTTGSSIVLQIGLGNHAESRIALRHLGGDAFVGGDTAVRFERSDRGEVVAMRLSRYRAREVKFIRL